ncbi:arabinofuranosyltransferase [Tomitella fengzijianii]|uniref:Galactan 5-O-arabinofuranosyltransferase n=1 Tax=Tomitella fengzijianii TaxID=2597660 RepID=A0A516X797_9ACTN|nr:arabinofuranosyltransferase [Tomitella fengzijianii]
MAGALGSLAGAGVVAAAVTGAGLFVIDRTSLPAFTTSNMTQALTTLLQVASLAVITAGVLLLRRDGRSRRGRLFSWAGLSAFATVTLAVPLSATRLYLFGISVDQEFRTQFLTRMTATAGLHDMNYADLPSYYPAGWFWVGGRLADLLNMPGWEFYKPYAIGSLAVAIVVAAALWSRLIRADLAVMTATAQAAIVLAYGSPEAYGAIVAVLIPPVLVLAWSGLRASLRPGARRRTGWAAVIATGVFLGISACMYTLYTAFAAFTVVLMALAAAVAAAYLHARDAAVTGRTPAPLWRRMLAPAALRTAVSPLVRLAAAGIIAGLIALIVWAPYLLRMADHPTVDSTAMHYLPESGALLPLPMFNASLLGALSLLGLLWIVLKFRASVRAQALGIAVAAIYLWTLLSMAWTVLGSTLLSFRLEPVLLLLLGAAGVFAVFDIARWAVGRARLYQPAAVAGVRARRTRAVITVLGVIAAIMFAQNIPHVLQTEISVAYSDTDGYGERADKYPPGAAAYFDEVDAAIMDQVNTPRDDTVVLTTDFPFLSYYPYLGFQAITSHYANPLGDFAARTDAIKQWTEARDADEFLSELDSVPWRPPQAFIMRTSADGYTLRLSADVYPNDPNVKVFTVTFPRELFDSQEFTKTEIGPFTVIVRK